MSDKLRQALAELMRCTDTNVAWREWDDAWAAARNALAEPEPCIGADPLCPCQDGLACHYKDAADGTKRWPVPTAPSEAFVWDAYDLSTLPKRAKPASVLTDEQIDAVTREQCNNYYKALWLETEDELAKLRSTTCTKT